MRVRNGHLHLSLVIGTISALISSPILLWLSSVQPEPYMDEIFHIPQARNYCAYNLSHWDRKLTTPPGLYLSSLIIYIPFSIQTSLIELCSVFNLRATNIIFSSLSTVVVFLLLRSIYPSSNYFTSSLYALTLSQFPPLYFFSFLYYTDQGSTLFVLSALLAARQSRHNLSAMLFLVSLLFRQTNVIWVCFAAACTLLSRVESRIRSEAGLLERLVKAVVYLLLQLWPSLRTLLPYMLVCVSFLVYILWNGGIVLGDKSQHQVTLHFSQISYFVFIAGVFTWYEMLISIKRVFTTNFRQVVIWLLLLTILFLLFARFSTVTHPYLLADNRHYTFYFWRKIINYSAYTRYYLSIPYAIAAVLMTSLLIHGSSELYALVYWVSVVLVLSLQPLIEFRYFILPYLIFRIHSTHPQIETVLLDLATYSAVNIAALYSFVFKPFYWETSEDIQRFMW